MTKGHKKSKKKSSAPKGSFKAKHRRIDSKVLRKIRKDKSTVIVDMFSPGNSRGPEFSECTLNEMIFSFWKVQEFVDIAYTANIRSFTVHEHIKSEINVQKLLQWSSNYKGQKIKSGPGRKNQSSVVLSKDLVRSWVPQISKIKSLADCMTRVIREEAPGILPYPQGEDLNMSAEKKFPLLQIRMGIVDVNEHEEYPACVLEDATIVGILPFLIKERDIDQSEGSDSDEKEPPSFDLMPSYALNVRKMQGLVTVPEIQHTSILFPRMYGSLCPPWKNLRSEIKELSVGNMTIFAGQQAHDFNFETDKNHGGKTLFYLKVVLGVYINIPERIREQYQHELIHFELSLKNEHQITEKEKQKLKKSFSAHAKLVRMSEEELLIHMSKEFQDMIA